MREQQQQQQQQQQHLLPRELKHLFEVSVTLKTHQHMAQGKVRVSPRPGNPLSAGILLARRSHTHTHTHTLTSGR